MRISAKIFSIYFWLIPIFLLTIVSFRLSLKNEGCEGLISILSNFIIFGLFLFISLIILVFNTLKIIKKKGYEKHRYIIIIITISTLVFSLLMPSIKNELFLPKTTLKASIYQDQLDIGLLELYKDNSYRGTFGHIDWSCSFIDRYNISNDTLFLKGNPIQKSDSILANTYIFQDSILMPVINTNNTRKPEIMRFKKIKN